MRDILAIRYPGMSYQETPCHRNKDVVKKKKSEEIVVVAWLSSEVATNRKVPEFYKPIARMRTRRGERIANE